MAPRAGLEPATDRLTDGCYKAKNKEKKRIVSNFVKLKSFFNRIFFVNTDCSIALNAN